MKPSQKLLGAVVLTAVLLTIIGAFFGANLMEDYVVDSAAEEQPEGYGNGLLQKLQQ